VSDYRSWVGLKTLNSIVDEEPMAQFVFLYGRCLTKDPAFLPDSVRISRVSGIRENVVRRHYGRLRRSGFWTSQWLCNGPRLTESAYAEVSVLMLNTLRERKVSISYILYLVRFMVLLDDDGCIRQFPDQIARRLGLKYSAVLKLQKVFERKGLLVNGRVVSFLERPSAVTEEVT
jgi:hypothetical protein